MPDNTCAVGGCDRTAVTRGWCPAHYKRWWRTGDPLGKANWQAKVLAGIRIDEPDAGCWRIDGAQRQATTGYMKVYAAGRNQYAHRVVYELVVGPVPAGLELDHLCRNRWCVCPDHLEPVTREENIRRAVAARATCRRGHPYSEWGFRDSRGQRQCRLCARLRSHRHLLSRQ